MSESEWSRHPYRITTRFDELDLAVIQNFLSTSYWADSIPLEIVERACRGSLCFGLFHEPARTRGSNAKPEQVGFARVITDGATFGYLADVFVTEPHRGIGLAKWMVACVLEEPSVQGLRRWMLATRDAHGLYRPFGFSPLADPSKLMEIARPGIYRSG